MAVRYDSDDAIATLTIDDPARRNPLGADVIAGLLAGLGRASADPTIRVIVVTGSGSTFSAGGDLSSGFFDDPVGDHRMRGMFVELLQALWHAGKPTIARVNGSAVAGGFGVAVACDITICVEGATLGVPEAAVGLWPMLITVPMLRAMSPKVVLELCLTGRLLDPDEALRLGAVSRVVAPDALDAAVAETVAALTARSPAATRLGKDALNAVLGMDPDTAFDRLRTGLTAVASTEDAREGVAAFIDKRVPDFPGR